MNMMMMSIDDTQIFTNIMYALNEVLKNLHTHYERNIYVYHKKAKNTNIPQGFLSFFFFFFFFFFIDYDNCLIGKIW